MIQSAGIANIMGVRLPVVAGATFTVLNPMLIGADIGLIVGDPKDPSNGKYVGSVGRIALAGFVILMILVISRVFRGFISQIAVLLSLVLGTVVASFMHLVSFSNVSDADAFGFPKFFHFGHPKFVAAAIISMCIVRSRWVVTTCGVFLLILGLIPKFGQVVADMPGPVIGGGATVMFAMVTAVGIRTLHKVDFEDNHNLLIVATSLAVGLIPAFDLHFYDKFPKDFRTIFGSSITSTVIVVFVLNLVFNHFRPDHRGDAVDVALEHGAVAVDVVRHAEADAER